MTDHMTKVELIPASLTVMARKRLERTNVPRKYMDFAAKSVAKQRTLQDVRAREDRYKTLKDFHLRNLDGSLSLIPRLLLAIRLPQQ